jgi:hypothetical protein
MPKITFRRSWMDDEEDEAGIPCRFCSCLIGNEVAYGDDWGEGPICKTCANPTEEVQCDCIEDVTKLWGGHKKDCPNKIPF